MTAPAPVTQDEVRRHNLSRLLRQVHLRGATSRARLTALTGLNRSTVGALTTELAELGLVRETAPVGDGRAGRPSIVVEPESERTFALAVDLGVEHVIAARIGLGGVVHDRQEVRRVRPDNDVMKTVVAVHRSLEGLLASAPRGSACVGVGVGIAGVVGVDDNVVRFAPNLRWVDVPLGQMLAERLGGRLPVLVGNESDVGALAEHMRGAAVGRSDLIYLSGDIGVGGGIVVGGRPLQGTGGYAGEIGHMAVNPRDGRLCRCGRRGCWETEVGEEAVWLATGAPEGTPLEDVLAAYSAGDPGTVAGLHRVAFWMGVGLANLVNMFNPEVIVFGGGTRTLFAAIEAQSREVLADALTAPRDQVDLELAALGQDSIVIGAGELAFGRLLDNPTAALAPARLKA